MEEKKWKGLSALDLKLLAMALMLCDHLWATVVPGAAWLNDLGRLAFPIFAFQVVEGYFCTSDYLRYLKRMFLFALISEIPFNLMTGGGLLNPFEQNVMFTFCEALLLIRLMEKAREKNVWLWLLSVVFCLGAGYVLGTVTFVDYYGSGVVMVLLFYVFRGKKLGWLGLLLSMLYVNTELIGGMMYDVTLLGHSFQYYQQSYAVLALIPIWLYRGRQGPHSRGIQLACYWFYPAHMLILSLLALYVLK